DQDRPTSDERFAENSSVPSVRGVEPAAPEDRGSEPVRRGGFSGDAFTVQGGREDRIGNRGRVLIERCSIRTANRPHDALLEICTCTHAGRRGSQALGPLAANPI